MYYLTSTVNILPSYKKHSMGLWSLNFISLIWHLKLSLFKLTLSIILLPQELESRAEILFSIASIAHHSVHLTKSVIEDVLIKKYTLSQCKYLMSYRPKWCGCLCSCGSILGQTKILRSHHQWYFRHPTCQVESIV